MVRRPAVAGYFYPKKADELRDLLKGMVDPKAKKKKALGVVAPHAGFIYSGPVAGAVYSSVEIPDRVVILGPSHRGIRGLFGIMSEGTWQTPLGEVPVAAGLAKSIRERSPLVREDPSGHAAEHSLEVQLPFLQFLKPDFSFVPVCISPAAEYADLEGLAGALADAVLESGRETLLVSSTDMSHYISQEAARRLDFLAIDRILALDARGLFDVVQERGISMCGFQPTTAVILAAKRLGAGTAELVRYQTSGDASGDYDQVVGYAGLRVL
jgi:AmmeMemoRadiSam system protein B